jgi:beta-N-acetylhexosaminidase
VGAVVRFSVVMLCLGLIPSPAFAIQKPARIVTSFSGFIAVEEESGIAPWRSSKPSPELEGFGSDDCRWPGERFGQPGCAIHRRKATTRHEKDKQPPTSAKAKDINGAPVAKQPPVKKLVNRVPSDPKRNDEAAVPLPHASSLRAAVPKARPVSQSEERLRAMVGQLLLSGFEGRHPDDADVARVANAVHDGKISGVIIGGSNIESLAQLRELLTFITKGGADKTPLIAVDQPGGPDSALSEDKGFAFYTSANAVGGDYSPREAQLLYRDMAAELAALGITMNLGPSADICREEGVDLSASCFGGTPSHVAAFATAFNFGHHDRGVLTALRHVPFHTGSQASSISERANMVLLHEVISRQFSDAIVVRVKAVGPSSLPETSFGLPRSDIYRGSGFHGALIFDLDMGSIDAPVRHDEIIIRAFRAGADMVLLRDPSGLQEDLFSVAYEAVRSGLKSGRLRMERIEDAYRHARRLKEQLLGFRPHTQVAGIGRSLAAK